MFTRQLLAASLITLAAAGASAQNYVGIGLGISHNYDLGCVAGSVCERGANSSGKITLGHLFDTQPGMSGEFSHGVELMVFRAAEAQAGFRTSTGLVAGNGLAQGYGVTYAPQVSFGDLAIKGRAGLAYVKGSVNYVGNGSSDDMKLTPTVGLGGSYSLAKNFALTLDYDRLPVRFSSAEKSNLDLWSAGVSYKF